MRPNDHFKIGIIHTKNIYSVYYDNLQSTEYFLEHADVILYFYII